MPANKLPWPTIITSTGPAGRFTREQIRKAVLEVKAMREAEQARDAATARRQNRDR